MGNGDRKDMNSKLKFEEVVILDLFFYKHKDYIYLILSKSFIVLVVELKTTELFPSTLLMTIITTRTIKNRMTA